MMAPVLGSGCWPAWTAMVPSPSPAVFVSSFIGAYVCDGWRCARPRAGPAPRGRQDSPASGGGATARPLLPRAPSPPRTTRGEGVERIMPIRCFRLTLQVPADVLRYRSQAERIPVDILLVENYRLYERRM